MSERLEDFDATNAGRAIAGWVDELSNWYVRRSRPRFWSADPAAFATLRECLLVTARMLAPFCPFLADELYENLDGSEPSVHLCAFPSEADLPARDLELEAQMTTVRAVAALGGRARHQGKLKNRQPLRELRVAASAAERAALERLGGLVREELNVKAITCVDDAHGLGRVQIKPAFRALGPRLGKHMPAAAAAIAALDPAHVAATLRAGGEVGIVVDGQDHALGAGDLEVSTVPLEGYVIERDLGGLSIALDLALDDDLIREGRAREIVHAVQRARRAAGLAVGDRIVLELDGDRILLDAAAAHRDDIAGEVLARELRIGGPSLAADAHDTDVHVAEVAIDALPLTIRLWRTASDG